MRDSITVRLQYDVKSGSVAAAKEAIEHRFLQFLPGLEEFVGPDYHAKRYSADVNPEEVSGYSNYPTFQVAMFLSNNKPQYDNCRILAKNALREEMPTVWLADMLKEKVEQGWLQMDRQEEQLCGDVDTLAHSLLSAALGRVNWMEIAEEWLSQAREEAA